MLTTDERRCVPLTLPPASQRTTPGFSFSIVRRALLECIAGRKFGKPESAELVEFFGAECAYCGGPVARWDHLVPISCGGDTILGNVVPARSKCDDSKRDLAFDEWAVCAAAGSPLTRGVPDVQRRISKIREYVSRYSYMPKPPEERLTVEELRQFNVIVGDLARLRADVDGFIRSYRKRTGLL